MRPEFEVFAGAMGRIACTYDQLHVRLFVAKTRKGKTRGMWFKTYQAD